MSEPSANSPPVPDWGAHSFAAFRGRAIGDYALMETGLCELLAKMAGVADDVAGAIFYKITNADARNKIIAELIRKSVGPGHAAFWNSFFKMLSAVDRERNQIVHWIERTRVNLGEQGVTAYVTLAPGKTWSGLTGDDPRMRAEDLVEFSSKCRLIAQFAGCFVMYIAGDLPQEAMGDWNRVFTEPIELPLPANHPLSPVYAMPPSKPHPDSRA